MMKILQLVKSIISQNETPNTMMGAGLVRTLHVLLIGFFLSSCSEYLKGKPASIDYLEIKSDGKLACLNKVSSDMAKFLNSEGTDSEIDQTLNCIDITLSELQLRVEGRAHAASFTAEEVYQILSKFASQAKISQIAAENLIVLKAALLGGETSRITKSEIDHLKKYLVVVKGEAKKISPFIKLLYFKKTEKQYTKNNINEAFVQLNQSLKNLYKNSQLSSAAYSFDNFKEFIINILNLSGEDAAMFEIMNRLSKVLSGSHGVLSEAERLRYIDNVTEVLRLYSVYRNGHVKFEITNSGTLSESLDFIEAGLTLIENTLQFKNTQTISAQTIDGLIAAITNSNILSYKITGYTAAMFYRTVIVRVFESGAKGNIMAFTGIKGFHLRNMRRELLIYKVYSKMLERVSGEEVLAARGLTRAPLSEIQKNMAELSTANETEILSPLDLSLQAQIINCVNDLRSEFLSPLPIIFQNNKIGIAANQNLWNQNWKDLAQGFYIKMLTRLLMQGWGKIYPLENISANSLSELGLYNWYSEFKTIGIELKNFDPRKYNSGAAAYNTANLFTRAGNGDNLVSFREASEMLGIVATSENLFTNEISPDLASLGCNLAELDVFDKHWNYESCFSELLQKKYKIYFSNLPHLISYLNLKSTAEVKAYFDTSLNVVRIDEGNRGNKIETSEILSMNSLLHFIENLYLNHDTDTNAYLSEAEIRQSYPKFMQIATKFANKNSRAQIDEFISIRGTVAGYACFSEQHLIRESFIFLIYNGRTPTQSDFNNFPCFTNRPLMNFSGEVERLKLMNSFKSLKSVLGI